MTIDPEEIVDRNLVSDDKDRIIQTDVGDSTWGQLIFPSMSENESKTREGMRVLLFGAAMVVIVLYQKLS